MVNFFYIDKNSTNCQKFILLKCLAVFFMKFRELLMNEWVFKNIKKL